MFIPAGITNWQFPKANQHIRAGEVTQPHGLTHHTDQGLLEETLDQWLCSLSFQGELLVFIKTPNSSLKENKGGVKS